MAPVQLDPKIRYDMVALGAGQSLAVIFSTVLVGRSLWRSYRGLGPAQDTRERRLQRHRSIPLFASLAAVSLLCAAYTSTKYALLSYTAWASDRDIEIPQRIYGDQGILSQDADAVQVHVLQWLSDTPLYCEAVEILTERARRLWWAQQFDLGLVSWSLLLAIEGHRRNIPLLWSYQLLAQFASLSFAQNLFFIALLLTPTPLPRSGGALPVARYVRIRNAIFPPKPLHWTPHPALYVAVMLPTFAAIGAFSFLADSPALSHVVLGARGLTFVPLVLPYIVPVSWGRIQIDPHGAYGQYTGLFKFASVASLVLHSKATLVGLAYSAPDAHYHRHSIHLPFDTERRSSWERTTSGFGRLLGAMADHPVVSNVGSDVLLSAVSIGTWIAIRSTDVMAIMASCVPFFQLEDTVIAGARTPGSKSKGSRRSKNRASISSITKSEADDMDDASASARKKGRGRKSKSGSVGPDGEDGDEAYEPTPSEAALLVEGDVLPEAGTLGLESAALVWGLTALGGLGVGSAGALGGECVAR